MGPEDHELRSIDTLRDGMPDPNPPTPRHGLVKEGDGEGVRHRKRAACLLIFYLPFLLLPWIFTAVMMFRPINFPAYIDPDGTVTPRHLAALERWQKATRILGTIAATLGLPIVSALLAYGAVVYTQRRKPGHDLNALQMFTLADRAWMDFPGMWKAAWSPVRTSTVFLYLAAGLIFITAIQPPLQSILIQNETKLIMTCQGHRDMPDSYFSSDAECLADGINGVIVAHDPGPQGLASCPQVLVIQKTLEKILDVSRYDPQTYLWPGAGRRLWGGGEASESKNNFEKVYRTLVYAEGIPDFFVSSVSNGSSIGVYRQHAVRMDTKVKCTNVSASSFPKNCRGKAPFETQLSIPDLKIDVCVEGDSEATPWELNRDKQEHSERLWLNVSGNFDTAISLPNRQYTQKCESTSRRGWFELPSYHNDYIAGPLLDVWPSQEELKRDFNDYRITYENADVYPSNNDTDGGTNIEWTVPDKPYPRVAETGDAPTPGPLMTAVMAMFGDTSAFHSVATANRNMYNETLRNICEQILLPFSRYEFTRFDGIARACVYYDRSDSSPGIQTVLGKYFARFSDGIYLAMALEVAAYFANEAVITTTATDYASYGGRPIYSSPGTRITKPKKSIPGLVIISLLIFLQAAGLLALVVFVYSAPTWTRDLDADALTQMGAQMKDLGEPRPELRHVSGLVGVAETHHSDDASSMRTAVVETVRLVLGGEGIISSGTVKTLKVEEATRQRAARRAALLEAQRNARA